MTRAPTGVKMRKPFTAFIGAVRAIGRSLRSMVTKIEACVARFQSNSSRLPRVSLFLILPSLILLTAGSPVIARTPSGTALSNTVTASWSNSFGGRFSANSSVVDHVSNLIDYKMSSIAAAAAVGEISLFPVSLGVSNNFSDRFRLLVRSNAVTDMHVRFYADDNGNGLIDAADRPITNTDPIGEGAVYHLLVSVDVPAWFPAGTTNVIILESASFKSNAMLNGRVYTTNRVVTAAFTNSVTVLSAADRMKSLLLLDGSGSLADEDVTVTVHLALPPNATNSCRLWYDVGIDPDGPFGPVSSDRSVPLVFNGADWTAVIPSSDSRIVDGAVVHFIIEVDHKLYTPPAAASWEYAIRSRPDQGRGFDVFPTIVDTSAGDCLHILYSVSRTGGVLIEIYDLKGDLVKRYDEGMKEPGDYGPVLWCGDNHDARPVSAGLYFITIRSVGLNETRKVIIIK